MTGRTEIERALDDFLGEGPQTVADQALVRTLDAIDRTKQRRDLLAPWRLSLMSINSRLAAVMLVAAVAIGGGAYLLGQRSSVGPSSPAPASSPTPTSSAIAVAPTRAAPTPAPTADTTTWVPFTSAFYGFTVSHPGAWTEHPATGHWSLATQDEADVDFLWSPSGWPDFKGYEAKIPAGMTADAFIQAFNAPAVANACYPMPNIWTTTTIDGHAATIAYAGCNEHFYFARAITVIGNRIWIFDLDGPDRLLIVPFLSTVKLDPAAVVD